MTRPMLEKFLYKYAESDLRYVRKVGVMSIINTKVGTVTVGFRNGQYAIFNATDGWVGHEQAHYVGGKAGAKKWLVNNYEVVIS